MKTRWYTVICLYPDYLTDDFGGDIYTGRVKAEDGYAAGCKVQERAKATANAGSCDAVDDADDFRVVAVLRGKQQLEMNALDFDVEQDSRNNPH